MTGRFTSIKRQWRLSYVIPISGLVIGVGYVFGGWVLDVGYVLAGRLPHPEYVFPPLLVIAAVVTFAFGVIQSRSDRPIARLGGGLILSIGTLLLFGVPIVAKRCWTERAVQQLPVTDDATIIGDSHSIAAGDASPDYMLLFETNLSFAEAMGNLKKKYRERGWTSRDDFKTATEVQVYFTRGGETVVCQSAAWPEEAFAKGHTRRTIVVCQQQDPLTRAELLRRIW